VEATVNFQLLSTSEEEYLALNVRRFIAHFRDNPNFAKCVGFCPRLSFLLSFFLSFLSLGR
jgi:hypothetical protein